MTKRIGYYCSNVLM